MCVCVCSGTCHTCKSEYTKIILYTYLLLGSGSHGNRIRCGSATGAGVSEGDDPCTPQCDPLVFLHLLCRLDGRGTLPCRSPRSAADYGPNREVKKPRIILLLVQLVIKYSITEATIIGMVP